MISTDRRSISTIFLGAVASLFTPQVVKAQFTEQEVRNGLQVTSTGDVDVNQSASGSQIVDINGTPINGNGVYQTATGQVVVNDGQITSTGDVSVNQSASGGQEVSGVYSSGMSGDWECVPGYVIADPESGQLYYQRDDCCFYKVPCCAVKRPLGCEGDRCN